MGRELLIAALMVVGLAIAGPAYAISFDLNIDHCTGGCGTMPAGTVTLQQTGTTVDVTVHLLQGNLFASTGAVDFQAFKFNAVGVGVGDITIDAHTPTLVVNTGSFSGDGTGLFGFGIACSLGTCGPGGSNPFSADIMFHVASATIADLTAPNNLGFIFVADVLSGQTGNTGPVGARVPEPASLLLLGAGLAGIGIWRRRSTKI